MAKSLLPKQWKLHKEADATEFESWLESMLFHLSIDPKTARFLPDGNLNSWNNTDTRGFTDDIESFTPVEAKMSAVAKKACLNLVLGSISSHCSFINAGFIKKTVTCLNEIWDRLRSFLGFRQSGARITEFTEFTMESSESREALWERMFTFVEGNLLTSNGSVKHEGTIPARDEQFTPT